MSEDKQELTRRNLAKHTHEMMQDLAVKDSLTGLYNRRGFDLKLEEAYGHAKRFNEKLRLIFIDADDFKEINSKYTRPGGDKVLAAIARSMEQTFRDTDILARWGGDEFVVIAPATSDSLEFETEELNIRLNEKLRLNTPEGFTPTDLSLTVGVSDWNGISSLKELEDEVQAHMDRRK